ncbi:MAG: SusC/RagA family TonB-linked outer membrane protein [Saprospiraceae bacterium]|nr:SusC/RagA family TonB-linked outer membrane protein [Saprospiraceae bacterium]
MKRLSLVLALVLFGASFALAQKTVTGTVTDESGEALIGASILVKGTTSGTVTDLDGKYSLSVPEASSTLVFSYTGFNTQEVEVGAQTVIDLVMSEGVSLGEVVVTALGVEREEKALGYAVQQVKGDEVSRSGASNAVDGLVGKAAGIQVTRSSGSVGGGSRILIRGVTSMVGNNQPLIVIDGVRTNNETLLSQASTAGTAASNRLMDLNPEDIESINVLKGAAATALYGTSGSTGVILITTKKGAKQNRLDVNFTSSVGFDNITQMIDLQSEFAQGRPQDGFDYRGSETGESGSWGPRMSELEYATNRDHPNAPGASAFDAEGNYLYDKNGFLVPQGTGNGIPANIYNNVDPFFQTGMTFTNAISIAGGGETATFRLSASDLKATGVIPNEEYERKTVKLASSLSPIEGLTLSGSVNFTKSDYVRVQQGSNTSGLLLGMLRTPVSFDNTNGFSPEDAVDQVSAYQFPDFKQRNYRGGGGYDNPYWTVNNALGFEDVSRTFGNVKADYKFSDWAILGFNIGYDITTDIRKQEFEINSRTNAGGRVQHNEFNTQQYDSYFNLIGSGRLTDDIGLNYLVGANAFSFNNHHTQTRGDQLVFPGFLDLSNATAVSAFEDINRFRSLGFVGQVEVSYQSLLYLTLSARQDYDSRLGDPTDFKLENTGFFYPSASLAFVFSEMINSGGTGFSFGKLRLSYAQVGSPPPNAYSTSSVFVSPSIGDGWGDNIQFPIAGSTGFDQSALLGNPNLTPELSTTLEAGVDLRFLNGRLGLDVTYYRTETKDAILNASLPRSTGYANVWLNSGEMTSQGIEITLNATPIQTNAFSWNTQVNFTKSESIVNKLAPGIERLFLAGFNSAGTYLVEGNQYGAIFGGAYLREQAGTDTDQSLNIPGGQVVINDDPTSSEYGFQAVDPTQRSIGNPNPDFIIGWNNTFSYKRFTLNFLLDWREGGDLWNGTAWALSFFGRSQLTADTRQEAATPIAGVKSDGTPNDIAVTRGRNYWTSSVGGFGAVGEQFVQDGGWIRLREVGLSYSLPAKEWFKGGSIGVSGRNLWFQSDYDGIDPETSLTSTGNGQGFDYFNMPSTRSVIVKLSVNF